MQLLWKVIPQQASLAAKSWVADILLLLPPQLRENLPMRQRLHIAPFEGGYCLRAIRGGYRQEPGAIWSNDRQDWIDRDAANKLLALARNQFVDLEIPHNHILRQTIVLPRLAGENLNEAVAFGLAKWTPFSADEVYFAACPTTIDRSQITIVIKYTLKSQMRLLIEDASRIILPPDRLVFDGDGRWSVVLNGKKKQRLSWQRRLDAALVTAAFAVAFACAGAADRRQENELTAYRGALHRELSFLARENDTRRAMDATLKHQEVIARIRAEHYSMSEVIAELAGALPPDTSVLELEITAGRGRIEIANADPGNLRESLLRMKTMADVEFDHSATGQPVTVAFMIPKIKP